MTTTFNDMNEAKQYVREALQEFWQIVMNNER